MIDETPDHPLHSYWADPGKAEARKARARQIMDERGHELRRLALIAVRGCDVPPELEAEWRRLKRSKRMTNAAAAKALGLKYRRRQRRRPRKGDGLQNG